ncbi:MAG: Uma2 family endonuclease [Saprospiraceae bacterium]|nr:Uma2 family endonuclease [Saprospiraceae bacterium]
MTTLAAAARKYTVAEYLEIERTTGEKHAYYNGTIEPMAGASISHNRITRNILTELCNVFEKTIGFEAFGSDQKIYLPKFEYYVYPDAVVVAEEPLVSSEETNAIVNPLLIFEVLSPSTEKYDGGQKFLEYQSLPSFKEYVLVRQDVPELLLFYREQPDVWRSSEVAGLDREAHLRSVDVLLSLHKVYHKVLS